MTKHQKPARHDIETGLTSPQRRVVPRTFLAAWVTSSDLGTGWPGRTPAMRQHALALLSLRVVQIAIKRFGNETVFDLRNDKWTVTTYREPSQDSGTDRLAMRARVNQRHLSLHDA